jgi:CBS domain-containing protein
MSRVKDIIQDREMCSVEESDTVAEVVRCMAKRNIGAILVMKNGELRGVFSERDLMVRVVLPGLDPASTLVSQVMSTSLGTVEDCATLDEAMQRMRDHNCRHLPVKHGPDLVGFLSMRDVMHHELASKEEELGQMRAYIHGTV